MYAPYFFRQPYVTIKQHKIVNDAEFSLKPFSTALKVQVHLSAPNYVITTGKKKKIDLENVTAESLHYSGGKCFIFH